MGSHSEPMNIPTEHTVGRANNTTCMHVYTSRKCPLANYCKASVPKKGRRRYTYIHFSDSNVDDATDNN